MPKSQSNTCDADKLQRHCYNWIVVRCTIHFHQQTVTSNPRHKYDKQQYAHTASYMHEAEAQCG